MKTNEIEYTSKDIEEYHGYEDGELEWGEVRTKNLIFVE